MSLFSSENDKVGIAVVGLGYISQIAALPAFEKTSNCKIAALVSGDPKKLEELGKKYDVEALYDYDQYEECLSNADVHAVYIGLPNSMHKDFVRLAAKHGKHVLCEKPMAVTSKDCRMMIDVCESAGVKLMIAYRLHFEKVNMSAVDSIRNGEIGEVRMFSAAFGQQVKAGDIRTQGALGGGALYDMGIYCLNAARYFFKAEPTRVFAAVSNPTDDGRFDGVDALTGVILEFGAGRLATFVTSLACGEVSTCTIVGDKGSIKLDPAFDFQLKLRSETSVEGKSAGSESAESDQFAGELERFAEYIINDTAVEPDGNEGLTDLIIMEAILQSANEGKAVELQNLPKPRRPQPDKISKIRLSNPPDLVNAQSPSGK